MALQLNWITDFSIFFFYLARVSKLIFIKASCELTLNNLVRAKYFQVYLSLVLQPSQYQRSNNPFQLFI